MSLEALLSKKTSLFALVLILIAVSFYVRAYHISSESLYGDEPYSIFMAQKPLSELKEVFLHDQNPPMHIASLHFWMLVFGESDVSAKLFSVVCSVFAGLLLFLFCKKYLNTSTAFIAFTLFLFSNAQQFFSIEIRPYALVQLLCIASFYVYFGLLTHPKKSSIFLLFLTNLLLLFTHYLSVFILVTQFLFIWFYFKDNRKAFIYYFASHILLVIVFLPWVSVLLSNIPKEGSFWNHAPDGSEFMYNMNLLTGTNLLFYVFNGLVLLSLFLVIANRYYPVFSEKFYVRYYAVFVALYVLPIALDLLVSQKTPVFLTRYILYASFGLYLAIAYVFSCLKMNKILKGIFIAPLLLTVMYSFQIKQEREDNWKELVPIVKAKQDKNTVILICATYKFKDFAFYYDLEAFKNYSKSAELLAKKNVYFSPDDQWFGWNKLNFDTINKIIYVQSHAQFEDPEGKIKQFILNKGFKECSTYTWVNTGYTIYVKDGLSCNPVKVLKETTNAVCDVIKTYTGMNADGDTALIFRSSFEPEASCASIFGVVSDTASEGGYSLRLNDQNPFSPGVLRKISDLKNKKEISISGSVFNEKKSKCSLVVSVEKEGQTLFRDELEINEKLKETDKWKVFGFETILPENLPSDADLKIYFWNPLQKNVFIDQLEVIIY